MDVNPNDVMKHASRALTTGFAIALMAMSTAPAPEMKPYLHAQRLVDIGSRRLNIYCTGSGSPAVVLDAGAGDATDVWYKVQPAIARRTRVCSYDRAGMGFSDGTMSTRDAWSVVSDLHTLLHRAGIAPPYVLVAHSIAGLYAPLYADRFRNEVAGMVLVDPTPPYVYRREATVAPAVVKLAKVAQEFARKCYDAAASGVLKPGNKAYRECVGTSARPRSPAYWYDFVSEANSVEGSDSAQARQFQRNYGALPLIVLTAADGFKLAGIPHAQQISAWKMWKAMHDDIAARSSVGVNVVVANSGHYIQLDRPAAVLTAVYEVIDRTRARR